ncbi:MAG: amidohydrolase [Gammaproteobacteria bacterium]|nr:amidohydrolase [Gammaproteobacteria bacterium]
MKFASHFVHILILFATGSLVAGCGGKDDAGLAGADTVYRNGRIYTVDAARSWAEAVAIRDGRITYVGSNDGVQAHVGADTAVVDLKGRMMMPGFQDAHIHPIGAGVEASACDLNDLTGVTAYRSRISEYALANPDVTWILGGGWSMADFGPGGAPNKSILDELVPDRPVFLSSRDGHTGWANSAALKIAGIDKDTPDPVDGRIDRDPQTGEPIGSLQEGAQKLLSKHIPATTIDDKVAGLRYSVKLLNSFGITAIQDASVDEQALQTYKRLADNGELSLRVVGSIWWDRDRDMGQVPEIIALRDKYTSGLIDARTVKIMQDGVLENYTGVLLEPYLVPDQTRGIPMVEPELLKQVVARLDAEGFQVHFHAIGDGAIRQSLDAVEEALVQNGRLGHRHHISHIQLFDPSDIPRFKELDVVANFQPLWAYADDYITELTIPFIGEKRSRWLYPIKSMQDTGAVIAFGSDWSVSTANPYHQIETAITRKSSENDDMESFIPEERIDLETAIAAFTINAAFVNRTEKETGSVEIGKLADLVVLDQNLFEIEAKDISETKALLTLFEGRPVYGDIAAL